jgi:hypothetical protein
LWIWMQRTRLCMENRKRASSMVTTTITASCNCLARRDS